MSAQTYYYKFSSPLLVLPTIRIATAMIIGLALYPLVIETTDVTTKKVYEREGKIVDAHEEAIRDLLKPIARFAVLYCLGLTALLFMANILIGMEITWKRMPCNSEIEWRLDLYLLTTFLGFATTALMILFFHGWASFVPLLIVEALQILVDLTAHYMFYLLLKIYKDQKEITADVEHAIFPSKNIKA